MRAERVKCTGVGVDMLRDWVMPQYGERKKEEVSGHKQAMVDTLTRFTILQARCTIFRICTCCK